MSLDDIRNERIKKLKLLREAGMDPYPITSRSDAKIVKVLADFETLREQGKPFGVVGRVTAIREQGGLIFFNFSDGTGAMQGAFRKEDVGDELFSLFINAVDIGDFVELLGVPALTKRGEKTFFATSWRILAKSLRPLPDKHYGLTDTEERFRRRYLDLLSNEETRLRFEKRTRIIREIRLFLFKNGYMEVETPILQPVYGGASAEPFITHHNALDVDLYLRISDELYLKRLLIAGFPKVYEISKNFRNEGVDATHYPEFTMLEFYEAYSDAKKQMAFVEKLLKALVKKVTGESVVSQGGVEIDFSVKFTRKKYRDVLKQYAGIDRALTTSEKNIAEKAAELGVSVNQGDSRAKILDNIFKKVCRPKLVQPIFVTDYPAENLPLAKKNPKNETIVDAFQLYAGGLELVKAFSELNDPIDQKARLEVQEKQGRAGDEEAQPFDEDFIEAMEYGMPPAGGVGIGIDRLVMFLTGATNIKETILFPTMRPRK